MIPDTSGIAICARYAFAPNYFHYCGPQKQKDLKEYIGTHTTDKGLVAILNHFETLYPYLLFIASQNHIPNPFDPRVVEAYWLGNTLLDHVKISAFANHLTDTLALKKKIPKKEFTPFMDHAAYGTPNHTYHVLNVFIRTGHHVVPQTLATMDSCRISWGQIIEDGLVKTQPLEYVGGKLQLGNPVLKTVTSIGVAPQKGQFVSLHWGYICDVLTGVQLRKLQLYTAHALRSANKQYRKKQSL